MNWLETLEKFYLPNYNSDVYSGNVNNKGMVKKIKITRQSASKPHKSNVEGSTTRIEIISVPSSDGKWGESYLIWLWYSLNIIWEYKENI